METFKIVLNSEKCIGCWECFFLCPNENFTQLATSRKVDLQPEYDCLACLSCVHACPRQCIDIQEIYD
ncbi:MAG: 4Fe-4S dicluster domain-containing protein [Promethearchaeota archaeon]